MNPSRKLDPEATRNAILDAAQALFGDHGVNGVSMSQIAGHAGVTKSLIHHHFGSKDELWDQVKERVMGEYLEWQRRTLEEAPPTKDLLFDSITHYFSFLQRRPDVIRFLTWMAVEPENCRVKKDMEVTKLGVRRLREGQELGLLRDDVDPYSIIAAFLSVCEHWFQSRYVFCGLTGRDHDEDDDVFLDTVIKIMTRGLAPVPHEDGASP